MEIERNSDFSIDKTVTAKAVNNCISPFHIILLGQVQYNDSPKYPDLHNDAQ